MQNVFPSVWFANTGITPFFVPIAQMMKSSSISSDLKLKLFFKYFSGIRLPFHFLCQPAEASYYSLVVYSVILIYAVFIMQPRSVLGGGRFTALLAITFTTKVSHVRYQLVSHLHKSMKTQ